MCNTNYVASIGFLLQLSLELANSFGYEKNIIPPSCLVSVDGDCAVEGYIEILRCPVQLAGVSFLDGTSDPKIIIIRKMKTKPTRSLNPSEYSY